MAIKHRITSKHPRTGALPSEQSAAQLTELHPDNGGKDWVLQQDKLIWQLVMNCVDYASEQFGENLQFNSETLTNVLYDNIYDLLGEKVQEDEFVNWVADELVKNGAIVKTGESQKQTTEKSEPKEEVVYELDDSQYNELVAKVDASVQLLKANKLNIFKLFSETEEQIKDLSDEKKTGVKKDEQTLMRLRDEQITSLVQKIQGNQKTLEDYVQAQEDNREEIQEQIDGLQERFDEYRDEREKSISENRKLLETIKKTLVKLVKTSSELEKQSKAASWQKPVEQQKQEKVVQQKPEQTTKKSGEDISKNKPSSASKAKDAKGEGKKEEKGNQTTSAVNNTVYHKTNVVVKRWSYGRQVEDTKKPAKGEKPEKKEKPPIVVQPFPGLLNKSNVLNKKTKENIWEVKEKKSKGVEKKPVISEFGKVNPEVIGTPTKENGFPLAKKEQAQQMLKGSVEKSSVKGQKTQVSSSLSKLGQMKLPGKISKTFEKETGGKIPFSAFNAKDAKQFLTERPKTPEEKEEFVRKLVAKKVLDGKIKTPIPTKLIRPMAKGEEIAEKTIGKIDKFVDKITPKGKKQSQTVKSLEASAKEFEESQPKRLFLSDIEGSGKKPAQPAKNKQASGSAKKFESPKSKISKPIQKPISRKVMAKPYIPTLAKSPTGKPTTVGKGGFSSGLKKGLGFGLKHSQQKGSQISGSVGKWFQQNAGAKSGGKLKSMTSPSLKAAKPGKIASAPAKGKSMFGLGGGSPPKPPRPPKGGGLGGKTKAMGEWLSGKKAALSGPKPQKSSGKISSKLGKKINTKLDEKKDKKPSIGRRIGGFAKRTAGKVFGSVVRAKNRVVGAVSKSPIGSLFRAAKKVVKVIGKVIKVVAKVVNTVVKTVVKTAKVMWKTAKFATKAFVKGSVFVGMALKGITTGIVRGIKSFAKSVKKKGIVRAILDLNGAKFVTKLGWRAIKWSARKFWGWIKKAAIRIAGIFKRLFKFGGKFKNKKKFYLGTLLAGVKNKAYRFIANPLAGMLQVVFGFVAPLIMAPVKFLQWSIPSVLERFRNVMRDIRSAAKDLYKSTWSLFKKILFSPITIALLIGALVVFFWPKLVEWVKNGIANLGKGILNTVMQWVTDVWDFAKKVWKTIVPIATAIYEFVMWLTDPDSWVVQLVTRIIGTIMEIKSVIKKVMGFAGYDSLDFTCMWLAGDTIGLALAMIEGLCIKAWQWVSNLPFVRKIIAMIKALVKAKKLVADLPGVMWDSFKSVVKNVFTGNWGSIIDDAIAPWKSWWGAIKESMNNNSTYDERYEQHRVKLYESASESSKKTKQDVAIATRSLKMKGMYAERNLNYMDSISRVTNSITNKNVLGRIEHMSKLYMHNVDAVENYQKFITDVWESGSTSDENAANMLKALLESPILSQRLMTPFFYYNPQNEKVMMMRPAEYIGQFVQNIRKLVGTDENRDNIQVLKTIVMAFEQMNEEKWRIVDEQGKIINTFIGHVYNTDLHDQRNALDNYNKLRSLTRKFNRGDLFSKIRLQQSFEQFQKNDSITEKLKSKTTGEQFGNNVLLQVQQRHGPSAGRKNNIEDSRPVDYVVKMPEKPPANQAPTQFGNINIGPDISPFDSEEVLKKQKLSREQMYQKYENYEKKRQDMVAKYDSVDKAAAAGYQNLTFDQFISRYERAVKTQEQLEREKTLTEKDKMKKLAGMRIIKGIQEWQKQGKDVTEDENFVSINGKEAHTIWNLNTDGIEQDLYMFSPQWSKMVLKQKTSDSVMLKTLVEGGNNLKKFLDYGTEGGNAEEWGGEVGHEETEDERLEREEREQREREKEALNYSARVKNGYIEVKIDEDDSEIEQAWYQNERLFNQLSAKMPASEVVKRGVYSFPRYEDFVKYWRKKHGHPLDGIRRYKFTGKPVEHKVEFSVRKALSIEELQSHGIQVSDTGPVMVPADKAMQIAKSLFAAAKTVYSIRDGLEVMKMGLDHENAELKKRNANGPAVAAVGIPAPVAQNGVQIQSGEQPQAQPAPAA